MMKSFLREYLPLPERVREKKVSSFEDLLEEMPERGGDRRKGEIGREKEGHGIKSQAVVEKVEGLILNVSSGWKESIHDLKVFEGAGLVRSFGSYS